MPSSPQARELLQLISEGFLFVDRDFRIREINVEGVRMAGRARSDILGGILWDQAPRLRDSEIGRCLAEALDEGKPISLQHQYRWPHGREAWLEIRAFPSDDGLAIFYRDISDQKRSEEELRRAESELLQASRLSAMGTMAATLAHELAQPLNSAANAIEASGKLLRGLPDTRAREARHGLSLASGSIQRASDILRRLRSFVARGRVEAETQDLASLIADASVLMVPQAQREGVEIGFDLDPRARWVKADAVQVQQVLINLVRNAIEAMRDASDRHLVISTRAAAPRMIEILVEDSGPGIDPRRAETLFAPFHSNKPEGLGVGLSLCRTIVEAHGGTIEAEPRPGGGARFRFTLPRADPPVEE
jgi:two-component system, LuxR family, sensor kinase FixL